MIRFLLIIMILSTISLGGCVSKMATEVNKPTSSMAEPAIESKVDSSSVVPAGSGVLSKDVASPPGATLSTLSGKQLAIIYFDYDSFTLKPTVQDALARNAAWLMESPQVKVTIEGHCDERGSDEYNLALGDRRAKAVKNHLAALGIAGDRLVTISYGEERPATTGHDEQAWAQNRRVEFK